jgi:large subunit ribosomal protein L10
VFVCAFCESEPRSRQTQTRQRERRCGGQPQTREGRSRHRGARAARERGSGGADRVPRAQRPGEVKIYKNTLLRFAARDLGLEIEDLLTGPTAIAFAPKGADGSPGDAVAIAKALKKYAGENDALVIKGGVLGTKRLSEQDVRALADVAPREQLLSEIAGLLAAPMQQFASLLDAIPRNFVYALNALIEKQGGAPADAAEPAAEEAAAAEPAAEETAAAPAAEATEAAEPAAEETAAAEPAADE